MLIRQHTCRILLGVHPGPGPCPERRGQDGPVSLCDRISLFRTHSPKEEESEERGDEHGYVKRFTSKLAALTG